MLTGCKPELQKQLTAARYRKGYEMLERYEGKLSRTVLRRGGASNRPILSLLAKQIIQNDFVNSSTIALAINFFAPFTCFISTAPALKMNTSLSSVPIPPLPTSFATTIARL